MNVGMIFLGAYLVGTVLSFAILLRVLQLSVGLWSKKPSSQRLTVESDEKQTTDLDQIFTV
jgi:hypothetical protein